MTDREKWLELAEKNGITKNTFLSRVQRGMDPQEAATLPPNSFRREKTWSIPGFGLTNEQVKTAKKNGITEACMSTRLNYGWSVEEAMLVPPSGKREDFQKIKAKKKRLDRAQMAKDRTDIAAFASEIGISYGQAVCYLESGMSREEIREKYGKTYERTPHRWAKKEETQMEERRVEVKKVETKKEEKAIVKREEVEVKYHSENFSFLLRDAHIRITLGKSSHLKIEKAMAKELAQALLEIVR